MDRTGGISIVGGGKEVTTDDEMCKGDRVEKSKLLGDGVCLVSQSSAHSVGRKRGEVHSGVVMLDGSIVEDKGWEDRVAVDVKEGVLER